MKKIAKAFSGLILIAALFVLGNSMVITYPDEYKHDSKNKQQRDKF